jgi:hypothetical protein
MNHESQMAELRKLIEYATQAVNASEAARRQRVETGKNGATSWKDDDTAKLLAFAQHVKDMCMQENGSAYNVEHIVSSLPDDAAGRRQARMALEQIESECIASAKARQQQTKRSVETNHQKCTEATVYTRVDNSKPILKPFERAMFLTQDGEEVLAIHIGSGEYCIHCFYKNAKGTYWVNENGVCPSGHFLEPSSDLVARLEHIEWDQMKPVDEVQAVSDCIDKVAKLGGGVAGESEVRDIVGDLRKAVIDLVEMAAPNDKKLLSHIDFMFNRG